MYSGLGVSGFHTALRPGRPQESFPVTSRFTIVYGDVLLPEFPFRSYSD